MYVAVSKIVFEAGESPYDNREIKSLVTSLEKRFAICAKNCKDPGTGQYSIVTTLLDHKQESLNQRLDKISDFCEESGFGRIESERTFFEHIDNLFE